jgi:hypothetical protein
MNTTFNSLDAATQGLLSNNSFTIAIQGLLTFVTIEPPNIPSGVNIGGISYNYNPELPKRKTTKITVTCIKDDVTLKKTKYVKQVNVKTENVKVSIKENKIQIKIIP